MADDRYLIGFSNIYEQNPFTAEVRRQVEDYADAHPQVDIIVRDNDRDTPRAVRNSQEFADADVDVAIIFHIDQRAGEEVALPLRLKNIPIISVDIPIDRTIYFGLNNERVGREAGQVLADWIKTHWDGQIDKTLVIAEQLLLRFFQQRFLCALDVLEEEIPAYSRNNTLFVDNGQSPEVTAERVGNVIDRWHNQEHIAVVCMNDDVAVGALDAIYKQGRAEHVAMLSHDGTQIALDDFQREDGVMVVSTLLQAEEYGEKLIDLAVKLASGEQVEQWNYAETIPITPENYREYIDIK